MVTTVEPVAFPIWVTAEMVACAVDVTCGAVKLPPAVIAPSVALQLTAVVGAPLAKAVQALFCRD